jgi:hypothetical protein
MNIVSGTRIAKTDAPGSHTDDKIEEEAREQRKEAQKEHEELGEREKKGDLVNFRDIIKSEKVCLI